MSDQDETSIRFPAAFIDAVSHADGLETVLTVGAQWLPRLLPGTRGSIGFLDGARLVSRVVRTDGDYDPGFNVHQINAGGPRHQVLHSGLPLILSERDLQTSGSPLLQALLQSGIRSMLIAPMLGGGKIVGALSVGGRNPSRYNDAQVDKLTCIGKFVASQARLMQQVRNIARQAETDTLTGLANRARLMRVLDGPGALHHVDGKGRVVGVLHIDLDHFKDINDTLGHAAGDAILRHAAGTMQGAVGATDLIARIGGDEFVVVTRTDPAGEHIALLAARLAQAVSQPLRLGDVEARVGASIGTAIASEIDSTADRLICNADIALYQVKRQGRGGVRAFCDGMRAASERRAQLLSDLHGAIDQRLFEPYFQPQVSMQTGHFSGFEMLARWPHPVLGLIDPEEFIDLAAEAGLSDQIDSIVRAKGLNALRRLRNDGWHAPRMSFNASARTLGDPGLVQNLMWDVLSLGLTPGDLVIEVRETDLIALGRQQGFDTVDMLSAAGFCVDLDDFGSGHAAISDLRRLSITGLKLHRSMTAPLPDPRSETIARAVIAMAKELNLSVVAEGIETTSQYTILRKFGCDVAQGFGVSRPLPLEGLITFMKGYGQAPVGLARSDYG